jgi:soluble lytic murein transglycosylase-like protein
MFSRASAGDSNTVSSSGAKGLMQLMDGTAAQFGVTYSFDPQQNLTGGAEFLRDLLTSPGARARPRAR